MADLASAKNLSGTCRKNIVFAQVDSQKVPFSFKRWIRKIQNKVEIPFSFFANQFAFFRSSLGKISFLKGAQPHGNFNSLSQSIQRNSFSFNRISAFVKMDTSVFVKANRGNLLFRENRLGFVSFANRINRIADHLRSERRRTADFSIDKMVQAQHDSNNGWPQRQEQSDYKRNDMLLAIAKAVFIALELCPVGC